MKTLGLATSINTDVGLILSISFDIKTPLNSVILV